MVSSFEEKQVLLNNACKESLEKDRFTEEYAQGVNRRLEAAVERNRKEAEKEIGRPTTFLEVAYNKMVEENRSA